MMDDESGESMEPMEEVPLKELGTSELDRFVAWLTERSRECIKYRLIFVFFSAPRPVATTTRCVI